MLTPSWDIGKVNTSLHEDTGSMKMAIFSCQDVKGFFFSFFFFLIKTLSNATALAHIHTIHVE